MTERDVSFHAVSSNGAQPFDDIDPGLAGWEDPKARIYEALRDDGFTLFCQPILALHSMQFPIAEVFVRMQEEEAALLPPGEFFPVLAHYRMLPDLDRWVVSRVVTHLAAGSRVPRFVVNVSGQTLEEVPFVKFVANALVAAGLPSAGLVFEIDESDVFDRPEEAARFATAVRALGCAVSIGGFGARAVSFAPLKTLRTDLLKVDGSIVRNVLRSTVALNKLQAMLRISEALGLELVAEFVEDQDVLTRLKALGVQYAQGFGIHEPISMAKLSPSFGER